MEQTAINFVDHLRCCSYGVPGTVAGLNQDVAANRETVCLNCMTVDCGVVSH